MVFCSHILSQKSRFIQYCTQEFTLFAPSVWSIHFHLQFKWHVFLTNQTSISFHFNLPLVKVKPVSLSFIYSKSNRFERILFFLCLVLGLLSSYADWTLVTWPVAVCSYSAQASGVSSSLGGTNCQNRGKYLSHSFKIVAPLVLPVFSYMK